MDASALESRIKSLENSSDSLGFWLMIMTLLVVIGLVLEYWHEVPECIAKLREARHWLWQPLCILAGALLITLGVAGEMVFEFLGSANSDALRRANDEVLANMKKQTADANERASYANERTEKLRASIAGRDLSEAQQRNIGVILAKYPGRTVWLRSYRADGEAKRLGVEIKQALALAHITVEDRLEQMYSDGPLLFGIEVTCAESAVRNQRAFAKDIISALSAKEMGRLSVLPLSEFACPSDEITEIHVGVRPPTTDADGPIDDDRKSTRRFSPTAIARLRSVLLAFPAQPIAASWDKRDAEIDEAMTDFAGACCGLGTAEWQLSVALRAAKSDLVGILVLVKPDADKKSREAAQALVAALRAEHVLVDGPRETGSMEEFLTPARPQDSPIPNAPIAIVIAKSRESRSHK